MNDVMIAITWATACFIGLVATIILIKGVLMLVFGFGCLGLMLVFIYLATRRLVLKKDGR